VAAAPAARRGGSYHAISCTRLTAVLLTTALACGVLALFVLAIVDSIQSFNKYYFSLFSARFDVVSAQAVTWINASLHFDASALKTSLGDLVKQVSAASALMGIVQAIVAIVVVLLFVLFLLRCATFAMTNDGQHRPCIR
jgi:predicted PurR-regulated permease PerM